MRHFLENCWPVAQMLSLLPQPWIIFFNSFRVETWLLCICVLLNSMVTYNNLNFGNKKLGEELKKAFIISCIFFCFWNWLFFSSSAWLPFPRAVSTINTSWCLNAPLLKKALRAPDPSPLSLGEGGGALTGLVFLNPVFQVTTLTLLISFPKTELPRVLLIINYKIKNKNHAGYFKQKGFAWTPSKAPRWNGIQQEFRAFGTNTKVKSNLGPWLTFLHRFLRSQESISLAWPGSHSILCALGRGEELSDPNDSVIGSRNYVPPTLHVGEGQLLEKKSRWD